MALDRHLAEYGVHDMSSDRIYSFTIQNGTTREKETTVGVSMVHIVLHRNLCTSPANELRERHGY